MYLYMYIIAQNVDIKWDIDNVHVIYMNTCTVKNKVGIAHQKCASWDNYHGN